MWLHVTNEMYTIICIEQGVTCRRSLPYRLPVTEHRTELLTSWFYHLHQVISCSLLSNWFRIQCSGKVFHTWQRMVRRGPFQPPAQQLIHVVFIFIETWTSCNISQFVMSEPKFSPKSPPLGSCLTNSFTQPLVILSTQWSWNEMHSSSLNLYYM